MAAFPGSHQIDGARFFAMGCAMRIRNLVTHRSTVPDEQTCLEMLAALSVLARWIDEAEVET
ncbi:MAG: TIGR02391 family protein [Acidimicrobiales bacterium]